MFETLKTQIAELAGISKDALHVHLGLAFYLLFLGLLRSSPASIVPLLGVFLVEVVNEISDTFHLRHGVWQVWNNDPVKDIINTMFWPLVIFAIFRLRALWLARKESQPGS